jgi:hypothetical protein
MPALLAVTVWGSKTGWPLAVMILYLAYLWEAGVMLMWSTLRSRAGLDHVALWTAGLLVGRHHLPLRRTATCAMSLTESSPY